MFHITCVRPHFLVRRWRTLRLCDTLAADQEMTDHLNRRDILWHQNWIFSNTAWDDFQSCLWQQKWKFYTRHRKCCQLCLWFSVSSFFPPVSCVTLYFLSLSFPSFLITSIWFQFLVFISSKQAFKAFS